MINQQKEFFMVFMRYKIKNDSFSIITRNGFLNMNFDICTKNSSDDSKFSVE